MIAGMMILPLGFASIFFSPFEGSTAAWWVGGALALAGLGFSAFAIPYSVLPAELGASPAERTSMTAWRMGFLGVALLGAGAVAPLLADANGGGRQGYQVMAASMACVILVGTFGGSTLHVGRLAPRLRQRRWARDRCARRWSRPVITDRFGSFSEFSC
jgi:glycoside/pentoside/hexuronide:cation symporter, GPH family